MRKEMTSASPTPSLDSLTGTAPLGALADALDAALDMNSGLSSSGGCSNGGSLSPTNTAAGSPPGRLGSPSSNGINGSFGSSTTKCPICQEIYSSPKVLPCLHTFCQGCLEKVYDLSDSLVCPTCRADAYLNGAGVAGLLTDYAYANQLQQNSVSAEGSSPHCTSCKSKESIAVARCFDCASLLCTNCVMAHQYMHCFEGHRVTTLGELQDAHEPEPRTRKLVVCPRHKTEPLQYFCKTCSVPICNECTILEHLKLAGHDWEPLQDSATTQIQLLAQGVQESRTRLGELRSQMQQLEQLTSRLSANFMKGQNEVNETAVFFRTLIEDRRTEVLKEIEGIFNSKQVAISMIGQKTQDAVEKLCQAVDFAERLMRYATYPEVLMFKKMIDNRLSAVTLAVNDALSSHAPNPDLEFIANYQAIQVGLRNTFGYIRSGGEMNGHLERNGERNGLIGSGSGKQQSSLPPAPIARPTSTSPQLNGHCNGTSHTNGLLERPFSNGHGPIGFDSSSVLGKRFGSGLGLGPYVTGHPPGQTSLSDLGLNGLNGYEKWSSGESSLFQNGCSDPFSSLSNSCNSNGPSIDPVLDLTSKLVSSSSFPPKSQLKRQKMIYHCKFGEFGVLEGQFTEPSGVAVNAQNDIIVADTNNHRIQIFDREGRFKFQFGECGKRDGQLLYPNRVAVVRPSGDIVVTERSPTHQIQLYNQYGQFVRKFGANILQHPRGVTVDNKGRIIVVECKVMRVLIFDQLGTVLQKFGCSKHLEFPNGVVVNDRQEIFISDNRAHCVKVFNYEGTYLRQIGGEGITNYPIGVGINSNGDILIADNHNNFNLTIFTQDGQLVSALESKVKHAQCFDVALMDDGSVVLASKDYRLYIYRYVQVPPIGL